MAHRAGPGGQCTRCGTGIVDGEVARALVAGRNGDDHVRSVEIVDGVVEQEGAAAVVAGAAEAHVRDSKPSS